MCGFNLAKQKRMQHQNNNQQDFDFITSNLINYPRIAAYYNNDNCKNLDNWDFQIRILTLLFFKKWQTISSRLDSSKRLKHLNIIPDISKKKVIGITASALLHWETSIHEALALSHVLLLAPQQHSQLRIGVFTEETLDALAENIVHESLELRLDIGGLI
ncbi:hypothetical protein [Parasitella parasitica]|uniref:Uncharacterized protein n=1 Tax=Parasitella parasitica TaxID=35722 RepID=A0A0B7MQ26_9FUNG|nr:hypothetical protein [Parasitella parasitica]